jgi:hypothetical protein
VWQREEIQELLPEKGERDMKTKIVFSCVLIGMTLATTALWLRIRALDASIDQLSQRLRAAPSVQSIVIPSPESDKAAEERRSPFRLIDASNVGVPWNVERAMIEEGQQTSKVFSR